MHALRTNSQTSNKQEDSAQLDVMYTVLQPPKQASFRAENTAQRGQHVFFVMFQSCLRVDECLGETYNPLFIVSTFTEILNKELVGHSKLFLLASCPQIIGSI